MWDHVCWIRGLKEEVDRSSWEGPWQTANRHASKCCSLLASCYALLSLLVCISWSPICTVFKKKSCFKTEKQILTGCSMYFIPKLALKTESLCFFSRNTSSWKRGPKHGHIELRRGVWERFQHSQLWMILSFDWSKWWMFVPKNEGANGWPLNMLDLPPHLVTVCNSHQQD